MLYGLKKSGFKRWANVARKKIDKPTAHHPRCALESSFQWYLINTRESHTPAAMQSRMKQVKERISWVV